MGALGTQNLNTNAGADDNQIQIPVQTSSNNNTDYSSGMEKTIAEIQAMSESEFDSYLKQAQSLDLDGFLPNVDTQRTIFAMGLNGTPNVVDTKTFNSIKGETLYRTVNWAGGNGVKISAPQILDQMAKSSVNRIGSGVYGDGHYFADSQRGSNAYGNTRGNAMATSFVRMKLNSNAKIISHTALDRMYRNDNSASARRIKKMSGVAGYGGGSSNGISIYALRKGYNVIDAGSYKVVIDRSAMTLENVYSPM